MEAKPITSAAAEIPVTITAPDWNNRRLFSLLWPLIIEQLLIVAMGIVDMVMVSYVGEHAVSGVSLVDAINFLFITAFNAMATGGSVVASQYIGRREGKNASLSARQLVYISILISLVLMTLSLCLSRQLLKLTYGNIESDVMEAAQSYFIVTAFSFPFLALYTSASALFRSMGNSKITMRIAIIVNIINVGGNALFIYVMGLGAAGAALSTLIGRMIAALFLLYHLMESKQQIINLKGITKIKLEFSMIKRILNIGIPSGLETAMFQFGKILVTRIFTTFGTAAIAANAVASTVNSLAFMPGSGYGMGLLIIAGQFIGAGDYKETKKYTKKLILLAYITYIFININIFFFMNPIINIFSLSKEAHNLCVTYLHIHLISSTLFWVLSFVLPNSLKAAGDVRYVMVVTISSMWLVRVCLAYLLAFIFNFGPAAVFFAMGADFLVRGIFFTSRWLSGKWMEKRVI